MEYKNRIADQLLRDKLEAMGAVLIECEGVADGKRINTLAKELLS